ncbi:MAG: hypothetical protein JXR37_29470 [Kiritimatiellae bacterium]|nr:hypothetical protein [Kiritimatiellia bacterium]
MKHVWSHLFAVVLLVPAADAAVRRIPAEEQEAYVAAHLALPRHYDIFWGKKDRQHLTGLWKLDIAWNYLTRDWVQANMTREPKGTRLNSGVTPPYEEIAPSRQHLAIGADVSAWADVLVPGSWHGAITEDKQAYRTGRKVYAFGGVGFYRKTFAVPAGKTGSRVMLHFDSVDTECVVWVNGREVGRHRNWRHQGSERVPGAYMDGFDLEITEAVTFGQENLLTVRVYDTGVPFPWDSPDPAGITGFVWLEYFPPQFFEEVMVSAPYGAGRVRVAARPAPGPAPAGSVRVEIKPWGSDDYRFPGASGASWAAQAALSAPDAEGWQHVEIETPGILAWDVWQPNLYELRILDGTGRLMGLERFGVRTFEARGRKFYLNDRPVYLFGKNTGDIIETHGAADNRDNIARAELRAKRAQNFTSQRVHTGPVPRLAYQLCDEIGLMVRDEWTPAPLKPLPPELQLVDYLGTHDVSASFTPDRKAFLPDLQLRLKRWIRYHHNCPSVITWSAGNEMAAGDANVRLYITLLHDFLEEHDPQRRPYTPSSGLHWGMGDPELRNKPLPASYLDYHNYQMIYTRWINGARDMNKEVDDLDRIYGGITVPVVNGEWLAHGGLDHRLCVLARETFDAAGELTPAAYVKLIGDLKARREPYGHHRVAREFCARLATGGVRAGRSYRDDAEARARYYHRAVELFRRDCPREVGYSIHGWGPWVQLQVDEQRGRRQGEFGGPEYDALKMAQQPLIAIPDFWDRHVLAGEPLAFAVHVINWSNADFEGALELRLAAGAADAAAAQTVGVGRLPISGRKVVDLSLPIGAGIPPGEYSLTLDLVHDGRRLSRNVHRVLVRSPSEFPPLATRWPVGLYEPLEGPDTVAGMLSAFGVPYKRVEDLDRLNGCRVLVLGRDSLDARVSRAARRLRAFIEGGGRLIVFGQSSAAQLPWAPALHYENCGSVPNADPIPLAHPVFRGMAPRDFEDWGPNHVVYSGWVQPLGPNVLAGGGTPRTGYAHTDAADFGMTVAEFRLGNGACLLSQLRISENYRRDSAARAAGYNILRYVLSDPSKTAHIPLLAGDTGEVSDQPIISRDEVGFVNFAKVSNRTLIDHDGSGFMGLREGLDDLSSGVKLFGNVPCVIKHGKCLVLGSTPAQAKAFPPERKEVGVWNAYRRLFFLHTATYVKAQDGEELMRYVIHLQTHKEPLTFVAKHNVDIADWHKPTSHENATVAWRSAKGKGVYLAQWENPYPDDKIRSIDIIAGQKAYVAVLGITGLLTEPVARAAQAE